MLSTTPAWKAKAGDHEVALEIKRRSKNWSGACAEHGNTPQTETRLFVDRVGCRRDRGNRPLVQRILSFLGTMPANLMYYSGAPGDRGQRENGYISYTEAELTPCCARRILEYARFLENMLTATR